MDHFSRASLSTVFYAARLWGLHMDHDTTIDVGSLIDPIELDVEDAGPDLPPVPPEQRREPPRRRPPRRPPNDDVIFTPAWTALGIVLMLLMGSVKLLTFWLASQGGLTTVILVSTLFALFFLGPFVAGSVWLGRLRRS